MTQKQMHGITSLQHGTHATPGGMSYPSRCFDKFANLPGGKRTNTTHLRNNQAIVAARSPIVNRLTGCGSMEQFSVG
jgi:hypothetical protein